MSRFNRGTSVDAELNVNMDLVGKDGWPDSVHVGTNKFSRASRRDDSVQTRQGSPGTTYKHPPSRQQKSGMSRTFDEIRNIHA